MPTPLVPIALSGAFGIKGGRLETLIGLLAPLFTADEPSRFVIDLQRLVSISPAAVALITAGLQRIADLELIVEGSYIMPPASPAVRNYVLRMNVVRPWIGDTDEGDAGSASGFSPCEHFTGADDYAEVARSLSDLVNGRCETDDIAAASIRICLDEVTENVVHHADALSGGFAAAQGWPKNSEMELAIVDLGRGIRASLIENPDHSDVADDAAAIVRALQPRVSATPERNAGIGLFITKLLLEANEGVLLVRSGHGTVQAGVHDRARIERVALPGTLVALRVRTDRVLNIASIYEHLEREHPSRHDDD